MSVNHMTDRPVGCITAATQEDAFLMGTSTPEETGRSLGDMASHKDSPRRVCAGMRAGWFGKALSQLDVKTSTIAVHYRLGCPDTARDQALWMLYRKELDKWAKEGKDRRVVIYTPAEAVGGHVKAVNQFSFKAPPTTGAPAESETPPEAPPMLIGNQSTKRKRSGFMSKAPNRSAAATPSPQTAPEEEQEEQKSGKEAKTESKSSGAGRPEAKATAPSVPLPETKLTHQTQLSSTWYVSKRRKTTGGITLPITPAPGSTVLVCGDRYWNNKERIASVLDMLDRSVKIVHGGCTGADTLGGEVGREQERMVFSEPADWKQHGRAAGPIRNALMLKTYTPCLVIAFHDRISESKGTVNMLDLANKARVPTVVFNSV